MQTALVLANLPPQPDGDIRIGPRHRQHLAPIKEFDRDTTQCLHRVRLLHEKDCFHPKEVAGQEYIDDLGPLVGYSARPGNPTRSQPINIAVQVAFRDDLVAWLERFGVWRHRSCECRFSSLQIFQEFRTMQWKLA